MKTMIRGLACAMVFVCTTVTALAAFGDDYVMFEGKGAVSTLQTTAAGNLAVAPADNSSSKADGTIGPVAKGKHKGELCFHGTFNGLADPDPDGIGWGLVKKVPADQKILDKFTTGAHAIEGSITVLLEMDKNCDAVDTATTKMQTAIDALMSVKTQIAGEVTAGHTTEKLAAGATADVQELIDLLTDLKTDVAAITADKTTSFEELLKKLAPFKKKAKKVSKLQRDIAKGLIKAGIFD